MKVYQRHDDGLRARQSVDEAIAWRYQNLLRAGFDADLATSTAENLRHDLHALLQLIDRGCPPQLAIRILEPSPSGVRS